ncbi:RWD domain-containing protein 2A [Anopheles aquasalis]|uniref:RWD domain-containing protein 2A n=1 Tax=Anopheles aquasalis TaxID=42839 RepID=UPI00215A1D42|nr:RWD domain-containing protein 2A [Anopheles aquasalis]XP_050098659.1 RWD domain-containing protein 2A [Anopheles aquasalis]
MMEEEALQLEFLKQNLQLQLDEFQMLSEIFCNAGELQLDDYGCIENLTSFIADTKERLNQKMEYHFMLPLLENEKVQILVELPHHYPVLEMPRIVIRSAIIARDQERELQMRIQQYIETEIIERQDPYVYQIICWIQDNFSDLLQSSRERKADSPSSPTTNADSTPKSIVFERLWIYSHHLKSKGKRQTIIKTARELGLTGFSRPGKPAIICIEGPQSDTQDFWRIIKALRWQKIQIKLNETETVFTDGSLEQTLAKLRRFETGFREELFCDMEEDSDAEDLPMSMSLFMKFLDKHNCNYIKKTLFGFQGSSNLS